MTASCMTAARAFGRALVCACACAVTVGASACGTSDADVARWERDEGGAELLAGVVRDEGASLERRRDATLALFRLERRGRHIGLDVALSTLAALGGAPRARLVAALAPELVRLTTLSRPPRGPDPSLAGKDAAYALVARGLASEPAVRADLAAALGQWAKASPVSRLDDVTQRYSFHQLARLLGAPSVASVVAVVSPIELRDRFAELVLEIGDEATKALARDTMVALARRIDAPAWLDEKRPEIEAADRAAHLRVTPEQLDTQVAQAQGQELVRTFAVLARFGGANGYLTTVARETMRAPHVRAAAIRSLDVAKITLASESAARLLAIANDDATGDAVLGATLDTLAAVDGAAPALYVLFASDHWPRRFGAAMAILRTLGPGDVGDFLRHLAAAEGRPMGIVEPIAYGVALAKIAGGPAALAQHLESRSRVVRITALGAYFGAPAEHRVTLARFERDVSPLPRCETRAPSGSGSARATCTWACDPARRANDDTPSAVPVRTIGDLVRLCLEPTLGRPSAPLPVSPFDESFRGALARAQQEITTTTTR